MTAGCLRALVLLAAALISACAGTLTRPGGPAPIEDHREDLDIEIPADPVLREGDGSLESYPGEVHRQTIESPQLRSDYEAVYALAQRAEGLSEQGDGALAVANLERALRIEPSNPWLWHRLASLHLEQGDLGQAQATAKRSNSLAQGSPAILRANAALLERIEALSSRTVPKGSPRPH